MSTLDLEEAAIFLKAGTDTVSELARTNVIPAAKIGRSWVFVDVELIDYIRSQYSAPCQTLKKEGMVTTQTRLLVS
jgi:excisionase family DNA binding protein